MTSKYGFTRFAIDEFENWISSQKVARTVLTIQEHHTFSPDYRLFNGKNHFELQKGMKDYHINQHGWSDIGQHFSSFPDGSIVTGRKLESSPACIFGNNAHAICMEHVGNFDKGRDNMTEAHKDTIVRMTAALCLRFNVPLNSDKVVYHHWFDLGTGERNNGTRNNKTCPGTAFFGGNSVEDCNRYFLPLVAKKMGRQKPVEPGAELEKYVIVTARSLSVRKKPNAQSEKASDRGAVQSGAILRVYREQDGWLKISSTRQHWVSGKFTKEVQRGVVKADVLNVRSGPDSKFSKVASYKKGQELFIVKEENGWCKVAMDDKWVSKEYLVLS